MCSTHEFGGNWACPYCSDEYQKIGHGGVCPKIQSIEYYPDGTIKKVTFKEVEDAWKKLYGSGTGNSPQAEQSQQRPYGSFHGPVFSMRQ